jgi:hypothetical protein
MKAVGKVRLVGRLETSQTIGRIALAVCLFVFGVAGCDMFAMPTDVPPLILPTHTATDTEAPTLTPTRTVQATPTLVEITPENDPTQELLPTLEETASASPTATDDAVPLKATWTPTLPLAPTRKPTATFTPPPSQTPPPPFLRIQRPGYLSRVISPVNVEMYTGPGEDGLVRVELIGEDGRIITRQEYNFKDYIGRRLWTNPKVPFEIAAAAETGRIQVSTFDRFKRMISLSSVTVILMKVGENRNNPPLVSIEPYIIDLPEAREIIQGGKLLVSARANPVNTSPVIVELIGEDRQVLASASLKVPAPSGRSTHTNFVTELEYRVQAKTSGRLTVRQEGERIPGTVWLASVEVILEP